MTLAPRRAALASQSQSWLMHEAACIAMMLCCKERARAEGIYLFCAI